MKLLWVLLASISLCSCAKNETSASSASASAQPAATDYERKLVATKAKYPFAQWRASGRFVAIFDRLIADLVSAGERAAEEQKIACFQRAVSALNDVHRGDVSLIETSEAEGLVELGNIVALAAGLEPRKYGHGEGPLSAGRDW